MAVVMTCDDGCVLDHNEAITSAYRECTVHSSSSLSVLLENHLIKHQDLLKINVPNYHSIDISQKTCPNSPPFQIVQGQQCILQHSAVNLCRQAGNHIHETKHPVQAAATRSGISVQTNVPAAKLAECTSETGSDTYHTNLMKITNNSAEGSETVAGSCNTGSNSHLLKSDHIRKACHRTETELETPVKIESNHCLLSKPSVSEKTSALHGDGKSSLYTAKLMTGQARKSGLRNETSSPVSDQRQTDTESQCQLLSSHSSQNNSGSNQFKDEKGNLEKSEKLKCMKFKSRPTECDLLPGSPSKESHATKSVPATVSLKLRHGFFALILPFMMDSQFEKVTRRFVQDGIIGSNCDRNINVTDIQQVLSSNRKKRKAERKTVTSEEERLLTVHKVLACSAREQGICLKNIPQPLDNNLLSRRCAQLDNEGDVFTKLLVAEDGSPIHHMGDCMEPLMIGADDSTEFSASELIHRRVCHRDTQPSIVDIDDTNYVLPAYSNFILSNLEDFCDHLHLQLDEDGYDLIVLDPPWENKSVKRKKSYHMVNEDGLQDLPISRLARPGCLVALWVTNNERLEDYSLYTLFPLWGVTSVARWHWVKVTQTGDLVSSMEGHKKPYEVLLLGRISSSSGTFKQETTNVPEGQVMMSIPCSLHSKKPPLAEILHPYLPADPKCLELFARNLWPGWTSWGREALKHQNLLFYEVTHNSS